MSKKLISFSLLTISILIISLSLVVAIESPDNSSEINDNNYYDNYVDNTYNQVKENIKDNTKESVKSDSKNIILNSTNFDEYVTNGTFNEKVSDGDTIDIQGKLDSSRYDLTIDKPINLISSTNDSYINLYTVLGSYSAGGTFKLASGASGTNITGINFDHTRIEISNVTNVVFDNCTVIGHAAVGFGVGMFSVRGGSDNITISNCYFETLTNGGHSNVVFAGATNVLFENNTIVGIGNIGNLFYLTTYNSAAENLTYGNQNITIRNNFINGTEANPVDICYALAVEGNNIWIENNTIEYFGKCIIPQWGQGNQNNITIINNTIPYGKNYLSFPNQTVKGNILNYVESNNNKLYNNTIKNLTTLGNLTLDGNNIETITINGNNVFINNNTINTLEDYAINIKDNTSNISITNNKLSSTKGRGIESINGSANELENNTIANSKIIITNNNLNEYFTNETGMINNYYTIKENKIIDNDTIIMHLNTTELGIYFTFRFNNSIFLEELTATGTTKSQKGTIEMIDNLYHLYMINSNINVSIDSTFSFSASSISIINSTLNSENGLTLSGTPVTIINSTISKSTITINGDNTTVINSKFITPPGGLKSRLSFNGQLINSSAPGTLSFSKNMIIINSTVYKLSQYNKVDSNNILELSTLNSQSNNYILTYLYTTYGSIIDVDTGLLKDSIIEGDTINVLEYDNENVNIIIDRPINLTGIQYEGVIKANVTFIEGSEGSNVTNVTFDGSVNINTTDINFIEGNIFNGENPFTNEINLPIIINIDCSSEVINNVETPLSVNVTTINGTVVNNGYVEIYNDGILIEKANLTDGYINSTFKIDYVVSDNPIRVWYYSEDDTYLNNNTIVYVKSIKSNVTLSLENNTVRVGENETVNVYVNADNNKTVDEGNVTFIIRSNKYVIPVVDGCASLNLIVDQSWYDRPILRLTYSGSDLFNTQSSGNIAMNILEAYPIVLKVDTTEFTVGSNATIKASIYKGNDTYSDINKGKVVFKVNGKTLKDSNGKVIYAKVVNGSATIENYEIPTSWNKDNLTIEAVYSGSVQLDALRSNKSEITVVKSEPTITTEDIVAGVASSITLKATVNDSGKIINSGKIAFKINGKTLKDANGKVIYAQIVNNTVSVEYTLPATYKAKTYNLVAVLISTDYERLEDTKTLTITKT